jgi:predicted permease
MNGPVTAGDEMSRFDGRWSDRREWGRTMFRRVIGGLQAIVRRRHVEADLDDELRQYVEAATEEHVRWGLDEREARRRALAAVGSPAAVKDHVRDVGWESIVESIWQDVRFAVRTLRKSPAFTAAVVATLGLGIGGTTAIFSVVNALFLQAPDGVSDPSSLRRVYIKRDAGSLQSPDGGPGFWTDYETMRASAPAFAAIGAYSPREMMTLGRGADAVQVRTALVSHDFLQTLGVHPARGRLFDAADDLPGGPPVVLISHVLWQERFGAAADIAGTSVRLNGRIVEVGGVTAKGFTGIDQDRIDIWIPPSLAVPLDVHSDADEAWRSTVLGIRYIARLTPGVTDTIAIAQATAALRHAEEVRPPSAREQMDLDPTPEVLTKPLTLAGALGGAEARNLSLWVMLVSVLALVVACANVANLLFARAIVRRREIGVRLSIGASAARVVRQQLTESLVLAFLGGVAGVVVAFGAVDLMRQFPLPPSAERIDGPVLVFALAMSLVTGLVFGIFPALRAARIDPVRALANARTVGAPQHVRTRRALIVVQIALSLVLLVGAGLFVRSVRQIAAIDSGVALDRLLVVTMDLTHAGYTPTVQDAVYDNATARLSTVPGVERSAVVHVAPLGGDYSVPVQWALPGRTVSMRQASVLNIVGAGYFETIGARVLRGRGIEASDSAGAEPVAVVNERMARLMADDGNVVGLCVPIGRQVRRGGCTRIVGVVEGQRRRYLETAVTPMIFEARTQNHDTNPFGTPSILVRTTGEPRLYAEAVRKAVASLRDDLPYVDVRPLAETEAVRSGVLPFRLGATLFALFGLLALTLSAVGLYGMLGYFVTDRTPEIGVRRALGAPRTAVIALVLRQGLVPTGLGLAAGLIVAAVSVRYLASQLFGIAPLDAVSFASAVVFLLLVALIATLVPARRAARVDPAVALRRE